MIYRTLLLVILTVPFVTFGQEYAGYSTDSVYMLPEARIESKWLNDTDRYRYNQMKYYVTTILPYMNEATKLFKELDGELKSRTMNKRAWRKYVKTKEEEIRTEFEDRVKQLNVTQGKLLVKLIARQTELNIYKMLKEFRSPLTAVKWQAWSKLNGLNLDRKYQPDEEATLESIMYELGYPLPVGYSMIHTGD